MCRLRDRLEAGGLNRRGDDHEPDDSDDLAAYQRADAGAEGAEQGSDGQRLSSPAGRV